MRCLSLVMLLFLSACVKDRPNPENKSIPNKDAIGVWVLNEGVFGNGNADISFIDLQQKKIYNNLSIVANGKTLGDVAHDILRIGNHLIIAVNNSNKITVLNAETLELEHEIKNVQFPRKLCKLNDSLIVVSSLYTDNVTILDYRTCIVHKTLKVNYPNTEGMLLHNGLLYITNWNKNSHYVYVFNATTFDWVKTITLKGKASHSIVADENNDIWILSGNKYQGVQSYLHKLNTSNNSVYDFPFGLDEDPMKFITSNSGDRLFILKVNFDGKAQYNGLYAMNISDTVLPQTPFITAPPTSYFYGLGIHPVNHHIFLSDPKGFTQQSATYEYSTSGSFIQEYKTGLGSNTFIFK